MDLVFGRRSFSWEEGLAVEALLDEPEECYNALGGAYYVLELSSNYFSGVLTRGRREALAALFDPNALACKSEWSGGDYMAWYAARRPWHRPLITQAPCLNLVDGWLDDFRYVLSTLMGNNSFIETDNEIEAGFLRRTAFAPHEVDLAWEYFLLGGRWSPCVTCCVRILSQSLSYDAIAARIADEGIKSKSLLKNYRDLLNSLQPLS